jgi:beta-glucosidase
MNGRPLAVQWLADSVSAVVESWLLGVEHGNALADVLVGDANPSGRLPVTFPRATGQVPIHYAHRNTGRPAAEENHYTSKYLDLPWTPLFPFGHGLSYTTFRYANLQVGPPSGRAGRSVRVSVDVTNTGARTGDEVVQLYVRDDAASVARPVRELKGFRRVTLRPGETAVVWFMLRPLDLSMYRPDMRRVVEPGTFTLWAGGSSAATLEAKYRVTGDTLLVAPAPRRMR